MTRQDGHDGGVLSPDLAAMGRGDKLGGLESEVTTGWIAVNCMLNGRQMCHLVGKNLLLMCLNLKLWMIDRIWVQLRKYLSID